MSNKNKLRIEIRLDKTDDKELIDFIDKNASTRAGFLKHILIMYKNKMESMQFNENEQAKEVDSEKDHKKLKRINDVSFSSNDFD